MSCYCRPRSYAPAAPICPTGCIQGGYHIIDAIDSVGPCGGEGSFDLATINTENEAFGGPLIYKVLSYDLTAFEIVNKTGSVVDFVFKEEAVVGEYYEIVYSVRSPSKNKSSVGKVLVGVKDLCLDVDCDSPELCNRCTGICENTPVDVSTGNECVNC